MLPLTDRNPLLPPLLAFGAGAMTAGADWQPAAASLWLPAALTATLAAIALLRWPQARFVFLILLLPLFFLCGLLYTESFLSPELPAHQLAQIINECLRSSWGISQATNRAPHSQEDNCRGARSAERESSGNFTGRIPPFPSTPRR